MQFHHSLGGKASEILLQGAQSEESMQYQAAGFTFVRTPWHAVPCIEMMLKVAGRFGRLPKEKVDVWAVRHNDQPPLWYWGFKQLPENELREMLASVQAVLFLDGPDGGQARAVQDLLYWFPQMPAGKLLQVRLASPACMELKDVQISVCCCANWRHTIFWAAQQHDLRMLVSELDLPLARYCCGSGISIPF